MRLLLVEDEASLRKRLMSQLASRGYVVDGAADGEEGLFFGREYKPDVAVIDIGLPKLSGIEVIQQLRADGLDFPIILLTARGSWRDKVEGLDAGADDYLVKPFHLEELLARLNALLRRSAGYARSLIRHGPVEIDTQSQQVRLHGTAIELTAFEYKVLEYLLFHLDQVVSKSELTEHIYAQDFDRDSNVIEVFVGRLRRKLDPDGKLELIETLRGRGYRLRPLPLE